MISNSIGFHLPAQILYLSGLVDNLVGLYCLFCQLFTAWRKQNSQGVSGGFPKRSVNSLIFTPSLTHQIGICFPQTAPLTKVGFCRNNERVISSTSTYENLQNFLPLLTVSINGSKITFLSMCICTKYF